MSIAVMIPHHSACALDDRATLHTAQLENGLQLVWEEDHRQPLVAIEARVQGGLRGEGRQVGTGITHAIEHMLFKGTPTRPSGTIEQEVRRYGGTINAFTSFDATGVSLFVESAHVTEALALLADILQHAVFDQAEFEKERAVIISEIQMNLDDPDRYLQQLFWNRHFLEHPYRHPILGYQPLLERLTVEELRAFYAAQYQPQQIVIACVGDLDGVQLPRIAEELFGRWPRGVTDPQQRLVPEEPPVAAAKTTLKERPVQNAYVLLGWSSTRLTDPDLYPLDVLASILGEGQSSRFYDTLVHRQQLAYSISAWNYTPYDPGIFGLQFRTDPEKVESATHAVVDIIRDVTAHGVTEAELRKAKNQVSAHYLFHLQTIEAKAADVADALLATGDPLFSRHYVQQIAAVTSDDVQKAARRYLDASKMTTAIIRPPEALPPAAPVPPQAMRSFKRVTLTNGATLLVGADHHLPIAAIVVAYRGGLRVEPPAQQGLSNLVAQLLTQGTKHKSAVEIARQVESLGGSLEAFSGRDAFGIVLQVLSKDLPEGLALAHELLSESTFPDQELEIQRTLIANALQAQEDEIFDVGGNLLRRTLFGRHPYRFNPLGDRATIAALTRSDVSAFAQRWLIPANMVVTVCGDLEPDAIEAALRTRVGALPSAPSAWPSRLPEETLTHVQKISQVMQREQALIMLGFLGSTHVAPDRCALEVLTATLSGMAGRLFQSVREEHGLSYTLGAVNIPGWDPGYLVIYAATRPEEQARVLQVLQEQLHLAASEGFAPAEVDQAKRYLIGLHRLDLQDVVHLAKRVTLDELYGLGADAWTTYETKIQAVTVDMVRAAARRYLTLDQRAQVSIAPNGRQE